ncbi:MAG TPA: hypothetical protein G4O00_06125 [Thermoflexia bacterium]|jgi:hypothetical protein|nr:hypothetical protein [Thermoflexia bacterium]
MRYAGPDRREWQVIHLLAGELARNRVSKNLVSQLHRYLLFDPGASPTEYLRRMVALKDALAGGKDEPRQREALAAIVGHFERTVSGLNWLQVLAWVARLMVAYRPEERGKRRRSPAEEQAIAERIRREMEADIQRLGEPCYG